jgi:hypothetical protein
MRTNIFVTALLLFIVGCTPQPTDQLTQQQKDQTKQEVKAICDSVWAQWGRMDAAATVQYLWDSPEFVAFNSDGSRSDFQSIKKMILEMPINTTALKLFPSREDFYVLAKDVVVYAWFGKSQFDMKSGDKMTYDPDAETFIFNKVGGKWKIVYVQESATIVTQKAGKK